MADVKISALPAASALTGTELVPIVQGGVTVQSTPAAFVSNGTLAVSGTNLSYTGTLTGGTGVVNIGSGQVYKDASGNLGVGTSSPAAPLSFANATGQKIRFYNALSGYGIGVESSEFRFVTDNSAVFTWGIGTYASPSERMRLDASGNLGLGVTPSAWSGLKAFEFAGVGSSLASAANNNVFLSANAWYNGTNWRYGITAAASQYQSFSGQHAWFTAPSGTAGNAISFTQAMTLDASGNLGIGATSPGAKLHVLTADGATTSITAGATGKLRVFGYADATRGALIDSINTAENTYLPLTINGSSLLLQTGAATRATLDASGNLGLGVTPSAWFSNFKGFDLSTAGAIAGSGNGTIIWGNSFIDGSVSERYKTNGYAVKYVAASDIGAHIWQIAPSGTAGNAISFTQAMTLDASGNLLVGTTTAKGTTTISSANATPSYTGNGQLVLTVTDTTVNSGGQIHFGGFYSGTNYTSYGAIKGAKQGGTNAGYLAFYTEPDTGELTERLRIDASGNLITNVNAAAPSLSTNSTMSFELTSNTSLKVVVRGTDGVTRSVSLTLS